MKSVEPVKMLSALTLVLLVFSVTDGRIISKCELKGKLDAALFQSITAMGENITVNNLIARLVCRANSTAFNTSFVKTIMVSNREKRSPQASSRPPPQAMPKAPLLKPSKAPPLNASKAPSHNATKAPPFKPSKAPPHNASKAPSHNATKAPPFKPSKAPPHNASKAPSHNATKAPPFKPSKAPPHNATKFPSHNATKSPSHNATKAPPLHGSKAPPLSKAPPQAPSSRVPPQAPSRIPPEPTNGPQGSGKETKRPLPTAATRGVKHLFGVFQLSDQLACDSGMVPSLNICNMNCNALIDDDITNDIDCLKMLMNSTNPKPKNASADVKIDISEMLSVKECRSVVPSELFADCA